MKKEFYFVLIMFVFLLLTPNTFAATTTNGIKIDNSNNNGTVLYCEYSNGTYIRINETDHLEIEPDAVQYPGYLPFTKYDYQELRDYNFLDSNNKWDCPLYAVLKPGKPKEIIKFSNELINNGEVLVSLNKNKSSCEGKCTIFTPTSNKKSCTYNIGNKQLKIEGEGNKCTITYPDGTSESKVNGVCSMISSNNCPDFYYNKKTKEMKWATYDYNEFFKNADHYNDDIYEFICGDDKKNIEYLCDENCEYPNNRNIKCDEITDIIKGSTKIPSLCKQTGVLSAFRFIGYLLMVVKIAVPIILIIMGSLDFSKAIMNSSQDAVKKATNMFATRIITGVAIFLLPTVINFVFNLLPESENNFKKCNTCLFKPNKCNINK